MSHVLTAVIPTHRPWPARLAAAAIDAWHRWRAGAARRRELLALQALDPHTLRDVGLADLVPPSSGSLGWMDWERGRW